MSAADVAVLGGGPAGLAVAAALARCGRTVVVFERERRIEPRAGETFGPRVKSLLQELGIAEPIVAVPFRGVRSAWGSGELSDRPSLLHPLGEGWHVDRARFEEALEHGAASAGAEIRRGSGACSAARDGDAFAVLAHGGEVLLRARYVVDASGRGAAASAQIDPRRSWVSIDRQIALVMRANVSLEPELLLESSEEGWWYAVPQPAGGSIVAWLTDADLLGPREGRAARMAEALQRTAHVGPAAQGAAGEPAAVRADTGFLVPDCGPGWCAVGDAAMGGDPLAGDGVERALSGALLAARAIERELDGAPFEPAVRRTAHIEAYLHARARYYAAEQRWPRSLYWQRRQPLDFRRAVLVLAPVDVIGRAAREPDAAALAPIEALLPRRALSAALEAIVRPKPAHAVLSLLRHDAPLDDRRLLVGLQLLVESGLAQRVLR